MTTIDLGSAIGIADAVHTGRISCREVVDASLARIAAVDSSVNAFLEVHAEAARSRANELDETLAHAPADAADSRPLAGVPIALKDNLTRTGDLTTCGSRILEGFVSPYSATVVERLEAAGAVILGRTNMDEFGMGSSTEFSCHGPTRNPYAADRSPGGSSGGSAAAVAARMVPIALGSDTGGSVRQPAALCGIAGLKPTYGRVSRLGLVAYASSLDTVAPFATNTADLARVLRVISGIDRRDSTSLDAPVPNYESPWTDGSDVRDLRGVRVGVPEDYFAEGLHDEVESLVRAALEQLRSLGATLVPIAMPYTRYAIPTYYLIATAEASSNLARYDGVRFGRRARVGGVDGGVGGDLQEMYLATRSEGFGDEVKRRIMLGCFCLREGYAEDWYVKAQRVRTLIRRDFDAAFEQCDVLASPTSPIPAFKLGEKIDDPLAMYLCDTLTTPANLAGVPGLSTPCGFTSDHLPVGMQLMAAPLDEASIFRVTAAYESATEFHLEEPSL